MAIDLKQKILTKTTQKPVQELVPEIIEDFKLKTDKKNQLLAFLKPEVFLDKTPSQVQKILDLVFEKLENYKVSVNGAAAFPGPAIGKYSIMDRHYGVINTLSKNASKILSKDERDLVFSTLGIKNKDTKILGGHEAYAMSGFDKTYDFDNYWLASPSTKIKSGFYVRTMKIADNEAIVVNGFHPHQLAHYTSPGRFLAVMLVSSDTPWSVLRNEMLGETFPEKALPSSIRGTMYANAKDYGFDKVAISNNIMHLSAGPTEALFEIDNFLKAPFGLDFIKEEANLAKKLKEEGVSEDFIRKIINDKEIHSQLEHKDTSEAVKLIKNKFSSKAS
jgi:nucleoside diphosphate kinase